MVLTSFDGILFKWTKNEFKIVFDWSRDEQPSGCDPELTGLAGAPLLCESLDAKEIRRVVRPCYAALAQSLDASKVARLHLLVHMCG